MALYRQPTTIRRREMVNSPGPKAAIILVVTLAIIASLVFIAYLSLKILRKQHPSPTYVPTQYLKRKWQAWHPRGTRVPKDGYSARLQENASVPTLHLRSDDRSSRAMSAYILPDMERALAQSEQEADIGDTVNRRTSVRSVMTLPAYSSAARENERTLGREGERDGIDVVIEQPETMEEEEARREEEMASLYEIRTQRRREIAEREQRSRDRHEARERGDRETLRRLRHESALRAEEREATGATSMIRDHRARSRERRVSSVSYGDLGIARHDGSRIRSDSNDSDRPLLDSAASISGNTLQPWQTHSTMSLHQRDASISSIRTASEQGETDFALPPFGRAGSDFEVVSLNPPHSRNTSQTHTPLTARSRDSSNSRPAPPVIETGQDLAEAHIPGTLPPAYDETHFEDAPPYESPVRDRAVQPEPQQQRPFSSSGAPLLPEISRLPSIRVAEPTPISPTARTDWASGNTASQE